MAQITVAQALARLLERMGTEYVFGVNGHGNWALLDALVHETRIKGIPCRAEDHALQMADGYWRVRRQAPMPTGRKFTVQASTLPSTSRTRRTTVSGVPGGSASRSSTLAGPWIWSTSTDRATTRSTWS